jgi:hypothetical protein
VLVVFLTVDGAGLEAMLCGGTMAAGDLICCCNHVDQKAACCSNHVGVTNMGGGIDGRIPPSH